MKYKVSFVKALYILKIRAKNRKQLIAAYKSTFTFPLVNRDKIHTTRKPRTIAAPQNNGNAKNFSILKSFEYYSQLTLSNPLKNIKSIRL